MILRSLTLRNFRIYKGVHSLSFSPSPHKNVIIVSGDNGFGKTTILTSLIWALYGKLMSDVDEKFKREIAASYGYKNFAISNLNKSVRNQSAQFPISDELRDNIVRNNYPENDTSLLEFKSLNEYSVTIVFSDVFLPSIPCEYVTITRTYDAFRELESVQILVDGKDNELTKEVGPDIFINDFILSREIAKFFFFDSEKIVSLAEMKTIEDKRKLSLAYGEVLGIKKYEDLKNNLENLRIKFRRRSAGLTDKEKLDKLSKECKDLEKLIEHLKSQQVENDVDLLSKRQQSEQFQEKLIREGNKISVGELIGLKNSRDKLKEKDSIIKGRLKELLELAPFAIAGKELSSTFNQMLLEQKHKSYNDNTALYNEKLKSINLELIHEFDRNPTLNERETVDKIVNDVFARNFFRNIDTHDDVSLLLDLNSNEEDELKSIYDNVRQSYNLVFKQIVRDAKINQSQLTRVIRQISQAESDENDLLIKEIRTAKTRVDKTIMQLESENRRLSEEIGGYQRELTNKNKIRTEISKRVDVDESDRLKDQLAERIISELTTFIRKLKITKKESLEIRIKHELNQLMHKPDFIKRIEVEILEDIIDIKLFDNEQLEIRKETLSKGEQQLYATAILKALVDEAGIKFPIFIDSPLQKFDKKHSNKIIKEFYPNISDQVVVFPLLEKELSEVEYQALLPSVSSSYIIHNDAKTSSFEEVAPDKLF